MEEQDQPDGMAANEEAGSTLGSSNQQGHQNFTEGDMTSNTDVGAATEVPDRANKQNSTEGGIDSDTAHGTVRGSSNQPSQQISTERDIESDAAHGSVHGSRNRQNVTGGCMASNTGSSGAAPARANQRDSGGDMASDTASTAARDPPNRPSNFELQQRGLARKDYISYKRLFWTLTQFGRKYRIHARTELNLTDDSEG